LKFEVLTTVTKKTRVFSDITPYSVVNICLHLLRRNVSRARREWEGSREWGAGTGALSEPIGVRRNLRGCVALGRAVLQ
jgi:hypothetical protein